MRKYSFDFLLLLLIVVITRGFVVLNEQFLVGLCFVLFITCIILYTGDDIKTSLLVKANGIIEHHTNYLIMQDNLDKRLESYATERLTLSRQLPLLNTFIEPAIYKGLYNIIYKTYNNHWEQLLSTLEENSQFNYNFPFHLQAAYNRELNSLNQIDCDVTGSNLVTVFASLEKPQLIHPIMDSFFNAFENTALVGSRFEENNQSDIPLSVDHIVEYLSGRVVGTQNEVIPQITPEQILLAKTRPINFLDDEFYVLEELNGLDESVRLLTNNLVLSDSTTDELAYITDNIVLKEQDSSLFNSLFEYKNYESANFIPEDYLDIEELNNFKINCDLFACLLR